MPSIALPQVFAILSTFVVAAMVAIIVSFALVTTDVLNSTVETAISRNLNVVEATVDQIIKQTEPLVNVLADTATHWGELGPRLQTAADLGFFHHSLEVCMASLHRGPHLTFLYQSYQRDNSTRWSDLACGRAGETYYGIVGTPELVDLYFFGGPLPINYTIVDTVPRDPTDADYTIAIREINAAHNVTAKWQKSTVFYDSGLDHVFTLTTYTVPLRYDPVDGHCTHAMSADVNTAHIGETLQTLVGDNSVLFLIETSGVMISSSVPVGELPIANVSATDSTQASLWNAFTAPNERIRESMAAVFGDQSAVPLVNGSREGTVDHGSYIVSYRHIVRPGLHWIVINSTPKEYYFGRSQRLTTILVVIASLVTLLCVAALIGVYAAVVRPIANLSTAMGRISRLEEGGIAMDEAPALSELKPMHDAYKKLDVAIHSFTRYVPRGVVKELIDSNQLCQLQMHPRRCTILFADIKSFTSISERLPAAVLSRLIREYFNRATTMVMQHNGMVDKFIGDCVMAVWSAPQHIDAHEMRATLCGLLLERETRKAPLRDMFDAEGEALEIRVGVNAGEVLAGNMGSDERMNYTVIGDSVNLAARLEGLNKHMCTNVMVSDSVAERLQDKFVLRLLGRVSVVGKEQPVAVYEPLGISPHATDEVLTDADAMALDAAPMDASLSLNDFRRRGELSPQHRSPQHGDDVSSVASSSHHTGQSYAEHGVSTLLRRGRKNGVEATEGDVLFASRYTLAVTHFVNGLFVDAIDELRDIERTFEERVVNNGEFMRLLSLCERYSMEPPEAFDGVYRATEK